MCTDIWFRVYDSLAWPSRTCSVFETRRTSLLLAEPTRKILKRVLVIRRIEEKTGRGIWITRYLDNIHQDFLDNFFSFFFF